MPKKLTMLGVLAALVLGVLGFAQNNADAAMQSFCTHTGAPADAGQCPGAAQPIDWYRCYENAASPASPQGPAPFTCGTDTSATNIPLGNGVTPIQVWNVIKVPIGSRLTLPITYTPGDWGQPAYAAGATTGDVTASTDILCTGGIPDILANNGAPPAPAANWPGNGWNGFPFIRQNLPPASPDGTTGSNNAYVTTIRPMPASFTDVSLDRANLEKLWLGGTIGLDLPPQLVPGIGGANDGTPLQTLTVSSPYKAGLKLQVSLLGGDPNPPNNSFLCLQSPQDSVSNQATLSPTVAGYYPTWTAFTSDRDFIDAQRTRILDVQCITVGAPASPDTDGDCLSDADETTNGTNSGVADTDGDGVVDGVEVASGSNPLAADGDADGVSDYTEMFQYTNPANADTDGDGSADKQDDLAGFNCIAVNSVCTVANLGDTAADDNCPVDANPTQDNYDSQPDFTNTPNTPAGAIYRGDATNPHQDPFGDACDTDSDNDGLNDVVEAGFMLANAPAPGVLWCQPNGTTEPSTLVTTNPLDSDDDDDGGLDGRECQFGSNPKNALNKFPAASGCPGLACTDPDGDLLFQANAETFYHTDGIVDATGTLVNDLEQPGSYGTPIPDTKTGPNDPDADGDYLNDGVEVKFYATDPADFDTDTDGCSDGREAADVNGDHKVNATDQLGIAQHTTTGSLKPIPAYFNPVTGQRRTELAVYDVNKDGNINSTDGLLAAKLTGNCAAGVGAQINSKPIIETSK